MDSVSLVVLFLSLPMALFCVDEKKECGEKLEYKIPLCDDIRCDPNKEITEVSVTKNNSLIDVELHCSDGSKFCVEFGESRKNMTLIVQDVTFADDGIYKLSITRAGGAIQPIPLRIIVQGVCKPMLFPRTDELTCEVQVKNTSEPTIVWMDKNRKYYQTKPFPKNRTENDTKLRDSLKLTDETRNVEMCCHVSYKKDGKPAEKLNCEPLLLHIGSSKDEMDNRTKIPIVIVCALAALLIGILYFLHRRRRSSTLSLLQAFRSSQKHRERTFSEVGLMEDQVENMDGVPTEPLKGPQDQV